MMRRGASPARSASFSRADVSHALAVVVWRIDVGQRIATRGVNAAGEPAWASLVEGYEVRDTPDLDGIVVYFGGARLH